MRTGVIAKKLGMSRCFAADGRHRPVTVLSLEDCQVVAHRVSARDQYTAVQLGAGVDKVKHTSRAMRGHFAAARVEPRRKLVEFRVAADALVDIGARISAAHFVAGQKVDVAAHSKGKGFSGVMRRYGFKGLRATHGVSISHRSGGSTGQCQEPGRVFKNKKMAGHMGARRVTVQNLEIIAVDAERGLLLVEGAVPGAKNGWVEVRDAIKLPVPVAAPYPAAIIADSPADSPADSSTDSPADSPANTEQKGD